MLDACLLVSWKVKATIVVMGCMHTVFILCHLKDDCEHKLRPNLNPKTKEPNSVEVWLILYNILK